MGNLKPMAWIGRVLKNRRAGQRKLAWNASNLAGPETLKLTSPDFAFDGTIPLIHISSRIGGKDVSPELDWSQAPEGTAQLLLVVQDPDAPTPAPFVHGVALLDPSVLRLPQGALAASDPGEGVRVLRSSAGRGYQGPAPIKGHGPHRYVFQLFALGAPVAVTNLDQARPRDVIAAAGGVLARGRLDGIYERI
jgi:Raf kinase inhibitor-like YbhB/YbcL family protein